MRQHLVRWRWKCLSTLMPKISLKFECTSLVTYMYNRYTTSHHMELAFSCRVYCTNHRHNRISTLNIMKQYPSRRHVLFPNWIRMIKARNPKTEIAGDFFSLDVFHSWRVTFLEHCLQLQVIKSMKLNWSAKYMFFYCVNYRLKTPLCPSPSTLLTQYFMGGCCYPAENDHN